MKNTYRKISCSRTRVDVFGEPYPKITGKDLNEAVMEDCINELFNNTNHLTFINIKIEKHGDSLIIKPRKWWEK